MTVHDIKRQIALTLCKARTDITLIRQYEKDYMIGMSDFIKLANERLPALTEAYDPCDTTAIVQRGELRALTFAAYDALVKEFL